MMAAISQSEMILWLVLCGVFVCISGLFSASETGLYCVNRLRLRLAAHEKDRSAERLHRLLSDEPGLLFTTLVGTNIANYLAPACLTIVFLGTLSAGSEAGREHLAEFYTTVILTPVVFIFGEVVPKNVFQRHADRFMLRISYALHLSYEFFRVTGVIAVQSWFSRLVLARLHRRSVSGSALHSRLDMYQMLREGAASGALSRTQVSILDRLRTLQSIRVGSVMVPRSKTVMLPADATRAQIQRIIRANRVSRIPVYQGERRRVVGVAHLLDLLTADPDGLSAEQARPPLELSPDMPVTEALSTLQRRRRRMAIAVDKWGHCVGIVTVKDLVEEIVGELAAW